MMIVNDYCPSIPVLGPGVEELGMMPCVLYVLVDLNTVKGREPAYRCYKGIVFLPDPSSKSYGRLRLEAGGMVSSRGTKVAYNELKTCFPAIKEKELAL